jgi:hypothetical protein
LRSWSRKRLSGCQLATINSSSSRIKRSLKSRLDRLETEVEARFASHIKGLEIALTGYTVAVKDFEEEGLRLRARVHQLESLSEVSGADLLKTEHDELKMKAAELSKQSQHQVSQTPP